MAWRHGRSVGGAGAGHVGAAVQSRQWTSGGVGGGGGWRREAAGASTAVGWTSLDFGLSLSLSLGPVHLDGRVGSDYEGPLDKTPSSIVRVAVLQP